MAPRDLFALARQLHYDREPHLLFAVMAEEVTSWRHQSYSR
jgi:hypothetical protein